MICRGRLREAYKYKWWHMMVLHGTLIDNLEAALKSARRYRGKSVYSDTINHWNALLEHSRGMLDVAPDPDAAT